MNPGRLPHQSETITNSAFQFDEIAFLYDELMAGVPYREWVEYAERILERFGCHPKTVLDLCCGTGSVGLLFAKKGCQVAGIDISPAMVELARQKAEDKGLRVDYRAQDASSLRLGRRFDLVVSLFDSLNYILESAALQEAFYRVAEHLHPDGLFIFDMNTELALAAGLFDQNNRGSRDPVVYDWRSSYDPDARLCTIRMSFLYRRSFPEKRIEVVHYQRAYDLGEIKEMLITAGLQVLAVYNAYTLREVTSRSDRVFFVARK